jgi:hypothetical protein
MDKDIVKWAVIENIVIFIVAAFLAYKVSAWCLLMIVLCNRFKVRSGE